MMVECLIDKSDGLDVNCIPYFIMYMVAMVLFNLCLREEYFICLFLIGQNG